MELLTGNSIIQEIVAEVKQLDELEQQILLTRLRVKKMAKKKRKPLARAVGVKPLTMEEIDWIKHESRKQHARK